MIAPLRRRHRLLTSALLPLAATGYVLALRARPSFSPVADAGAASPLGVEVGAPGGDFSMRIWVREGEAPELLLTPARDLSRPDVLVYWTPDEGSWETPPPEAILLGTLAGEEPRRYAIPPAMAEALAAGRPGGLLLYSLGHAEPVASASLAPLAPGISESLGKR